jgi:hypothetical protein
LGAIGRARLDHDDVAAGVGTWVHNDDLAFITIPAAVVIAGIPLGVADIAFHVTDTSGLTVNDQRFATGEKQR